MNEKQTSEENSIRPTKKQRELLTFIEEFIGQHGYSPSYREIMNGLNYTSVATVSLHVNSLIKRGHLRKRDHSARSLEVVTDGTTATVTSNQVKAGEEKWLIEKVEHLFKEAENTAQLTNQTLQGLATMLESLKVLGLEGAAQSFVPRLATLQQPATETAKAD
jgi:SOS-response transcriptional repressor LexA